MKKDRKGNIGCYVYRHIRVDKNEVFYIGIGSGYDYQRAFQKKKRNEYWQNIVAITDYYVEIIIDNLTREQAEQKEIEFISLYGLSKDGGTLCNMTLGGDGSYGLRGERSPNFGKKHSPQRVENMRRAVIASITDETRRKLSESAKKRKLSDETKQKLREIFSGPNSPIRGIKRTPQQIENIRIAQTGKKMSDECKMKVSAFHKGKVLSEDTKRKISHALKLAWAKKRLSLMPNHGSNC